MKIMKLDKVFLVIMAIIVAIMCFAQISIAPENFEPATEASLMQSNAGNDIAMQASLLSVGAGNSLIPFIVFLLPLGAGYIYYLKKHKL